MNIKKKAWNKVGERPRVPNKSSGATGEQCSTKNLLPTLPTVQLGLAVTYCVHVYLG